VPARKSAVGPSRASRKTGPIPIETTKHTSARRKNIPTADLEALVRDEERAPKIVLYPRNPDLDPQLVWRGKEKQDAKDLAVPAVPIYIQEKIAPRAIIEDLRAEKKRAGREPQLDLFGDFNGIEFEELVQFYQHDQHWTNRMILGDSLLVMTSLAEKEGLKGQVQMIYMDPPYGIKFGSNWQVSTRRRDVRDGRAEDAAGEPEVVRAFRDTWELGVHSYLSYLRDRLVGARDLLSQTGSIFVQIGDENLHLVRSLLDEVFGSENSCQVIPFRKKLMPLGATLLEGMFDYLLWYARDRSSVQFSHLYRRSEPTYSSRWTSVQLPSGERRRLTAHEVGDLTLLPPGSHVYRLVSQRAPSFSQNGVYEFEFEGKVYSPPAGGCWVSPRSAMERFAAARRLEAEGDNLSYVYFHDDFPYSKLTNVWADTSPVQDKTFVVQTSVGVVERCIQMTTRPGDLVLDPTCGSGTTAFVAEQWGRRWITIDTSRVALALARTRLMSARLPFYILRDSPLGIVKEAEGSRLPPPSPLPPTKDDIRQGFVYEAVPHVTLKSIANNPDIRKGMARAEIDAAIARLTETELLYDRPYAENKVVRVAGPFTVESLSPHRVLPEDVPEPRPVENGSPDRFVAHILDNLREAGVQNTFKGERLVFEALDTWPGTHVQAMGDYTEGGKSRRVAVSIGPEYSTIGVELVREAAKEAAKAGAETLVLCGFAFDPHVADEPTQYGKLTVLKAKMNPDLLIGDELLKKTGAANLFMVFGEPDIDIRPTRDGAYEVEVKGIDVYDPTTGQVRSHTTDDIATWFIDTNYDGNSFFVRHAYFLGGDDPYEKLKRALRADIDEASWATLYRSTSRPFPKPETGKIAVKVINHYGDEVLKVYPVS
jgi:adenine-specific DNA-methyltransferase